MLKNINVNAVLSIALVGGLAAFLFVPGRRQGLGRWAMGMAGALYIGMLVSGRLGVDFLAFARDLFAPNEMPLMRRCAQAGDCRAQWHQARLPRLHPIQ